MANNERNRIHDVVELTRETVLEVAERTAMADTFADYIYRESEVDALWSLADIAATRPQPGVDLEKMARIRDRLQEAHDHLPEHEGAQAAALLKDIANDL
ncbi:hypothetical protein AADG42_01645 [Ammonicoccus fulvus]|uniref:Uncharacterized protein n=1 Tax=Ammonicoccus fulvus TaxID=3138240 RepID=A0ABZ3FML5_9ACTN